ncbi:MAG: phosphate acyltransferase, partial [Pseudomonadota bacterium]
MPSEQTISLDAMGGDRGTETVVAGAAISLERHPELSFLLHGDADRLSRALKSHSALKQRSEIVPTEGVIAMDAKPSQAMRKGKGTSMWSAIEAVQRDDAGVAVSGGNTGALMAISKLQLRPLGEIDRPAIAAIWPTVDGESIVLDVGANIGASSRQL